MKTSCIIDNYNYDSYLVAAVESAIRQTTPFDEIIIVDDGSTDGSREIITGKWGSTAGVKVIFQPNGGQMSAFNAGFEAATGDLICFLDSDDAYQPEYLENTVAFYQTHPSCDFAFCAYEKFGAASEVVVTYPSVKDLGISLVRVNARKTWIGGPTSTISMRRCVAERILPYPHTEPWRSRADDVLVFGASLVGAHKFFNQQVLVRYRIHSENAWHGKSFPSSVRLKRELAIMQLFTHFREAMGYHEDLCDLAYLEFRTHPAPDYKLAKDYYRVIRSGMTSPARKVKYFMKLVKHVLDGKKQRQSDASVE